MQKNSVLVYVEHSEKQISEVSLELICKARELADLLKVQVSAIVIGHDLEAKLPVLAHYGCDAVSYVDDLRLEHYTSLPYAKTVIKLIQKYAPQIVLFGASRNGRDLAPRVASALKCGLTADCTDLQIGDYSFKDKHWQNILLQIRPAFGGNIVATIVSPESMPSMATVREGVMKMNPPDLSRRLQASREPAELSVEDFPTSVLEVIRQAKSVNLKGAKIIVAAGMGIASLESLNLVKELAKTLGAEVAATRPVVDAGFLSLDHQIGQTGTTVRPMLYIACGISGQIQHVAGMNESKRIIAINIDAEAPIFNIAHYKIVADLNTVIPNLIKAYKDRHKGV